MTQDVGSTVEPLTRKTPEELTELARGIVTNRIYAAWSDEALEYSFGFLIMMLAGSAQADGEDTSWMRDIGLVYQDMEHASDRGVNGYPQFFSGKMLHREDRIPLQRECIRLQVALGEVEQSVLDQFDTDVEDFKTQLALAAEAAAAPGESEEETQ